MPLYMLQEQLLYKNKIFHKISCSVCKIVKAVTTIRQGYQLEDLGKELKYAG